MSSTLLETGIATAMPLPSDVDTRDSDVKGQIILEARTQQKYGLQEMLP